MIAYKLCKRIERDDTLARLRGLADDLSLFEMKKIIERDAILKMILLLPEEVIDQALSVGKALQACATHRRSFLGDQEGDCHK